MTSQIERFLLEILHRNGIQPTKTELDDCLNRLVCGMWNKLNKERMDEITLTKGRVDALSIVLPNGRVGEQYKAEVDFKVEGVAEYELIGLEPTKLTYEKTDSGFRITGVAQPEDIKGGDFPLTLRYKPQALLDGQDRLERKLNLILNPDPKTLWKDIPTPDSVPYYKPDSDNAYVTVEAANGEPRKDMVAASQRGRSHAHEGKPRDDDFKLHYCKDTEWYIMAVADGAGSAKYSRKGSRLACEVVVEHCKNALNDSADFETAIKAYAEDKEQLRSVRDHVYKILGNAAWKAHNVIKEEAKTVEGAKPKDYATTLLLAICKRFEFGWAVASFWVGDGAMCVYDKDKHTAEMLGMPDEGEFAGQTRFLTMQEIFSDSTSFYNRLRFKIYPDFTALMLMTDGVSDPKFETDANLQNPEKWDALWKDLAENGVELTDDNEKSQEQLLEWLNFWDRGNHDDRTIAILY